MKATTGIGIGAALAALTIAAIMEGTSPPAFINIPAALIVLGGTFFVTMASTTMDRMKAIPSLFKKAIQGNEPDLNARVESIVALAEKARRDGLLALDDELAALDDEFTRKGFQLVVDGTDPALVREVLTNEIEGMEHRHALGARPFEKAGGFAPTLGILGCVMALVTVLGNLSAPETLGPSISVAFIATLYGVGAANVVFLPVAYKLKELSEAEAEERWLTLEGVLAVQAGDNPRVVAEKLYAFVPPDQRGQGGEADSTSKPAADAAAQERAAA